MKQPNPWKKISSEIVYQNAWITVREDQVIRPDGKPGIYGVVETRIATGVIALTPDQQIYLVGQYRYPVDQYSWEIIEGGSDPGESALDAAKRELKEEAGLTAQTWQPLGGEIHLSNCHSSEVAYAYLATDLQSGTAQPDETEILEIKTLPAKQVFAMVDSGEIKDGLSIIALQRLRLLLQAEAR